MDRTMTRMESMKGQKNPVLPPAHFVDRGAAATTTSPLGLGVMQTGTDRSWMHRNHSITHWNGLCGGVTF
jgi:hypothetical protein